MLLIIMNSFLFFFMGVCFTYLELAAGIHKAVKGFYLQYLLYVNTESQISYH